MQAKHLINMTPPPTGCPIGTVVAWMGTASSLANITSDWTIANGGTLSKSLYPELFAVIGYKYGQSGDTFRLPNLTDNKFLEYSTINEAGVVKSPALPNIVGELSNASGDDEGPFPGIVTGTGAFAIMKVPGNGSDGASRRGAHGCTFDASRCNSVYKSGVNKVQPYSMTVIPIIKVK